MLDAEWRAVDEQKEATEPALEEAARSYFAWEEEQVLAVLRQARAQRLEVDIRIEDLLDVTEAAAELLSRLEEPMLDAIREGFRTGRLRIDAEGPTFDPDAPGVQDVVMQLFDVLENVPKTSRGRLAEIVTQGYAEGLPLSTVIGEVQALYAGTDEAEGMSRRRAKTIARTTSTGAFERGQLESFRANDIQAKEWLTTRDGRQREGHGEANGQRREAHEHFDVRPTTDLPRESLMHPGDPTASVENVANCRCTMLPAFGDEQDADNSAILGVIETDGP
jgi:hypothetical protein